MLFASLLCCPALLPLGWGWVGFSLIRKMFAAGLILSVFWSHLFAFVGALQWPGADLWVETEGGDVREEGVLMLSVSYYMSIGQERLLFLKGLSLAISGLVVQFKCPL